MSYQDHTEVLSNNPPRSKSSVYRHDLEFARKLQEEYDEAEQEDEQNDGEFSPEDDHYLAKRMAMEEEDLRLAAEMQARPSCFGALQKLNEDDDVLANLKSIESEVVDYDEDLARRLALEEHDRQLAAEVHARGSLVLRPNEDGLGGLDSSVTSNYDEDMLLARQLAEELQVQETPQQPRTDRNRFVHSIHYPATGRNIATAAPAHREMPEDTSEDTCDNLITAECTVVQPDPSCGNMTTSRRSSQDRNQEADRNSQIDLGMNQFDEIPSLLPKKSHQKRDKNVSRLRRNISGGSKDSRKGKK